MDVRPAKGRALPIAMAIMRFLVVAVTTYLGHSVLNLTLVIGVLGIPAFTRVSRAVISLACGGAVETP